MIKMAGTSVDGRQVILLGLSEGNLKRLRERKPIHIHSEEFNIPGIDVIICWGPTEDDLMKELQSLIGPETEMRDHREEKKQ